MVGLLKKAFRNSRYILGFFRRCSKIGLRITIIEWYKYYHKYSKLPERIKKSPSLFYKIFVWHNYLRIIFYIPEINQSKLLNIIPKYFAKEILSHKTNPPSEKYLLVDKVKFYRILSKHMIRFPQTYFYYKDGFYFNLNGKRIVDFDSYMDRKMFVKSLDGSSGRGANIIIFNHNYLKRNKDELIFQEFVQSENSIKNLAPVEATSTIRINSYLDKSNNVELCSAFIKLPSQGSVSDNMNSGSIGIAIDFHTGQLSKEGITAKGSTDLNGQRIIRHPNSDLDFGGTILPFWPDTLAVIKRLHLIFNKLRFIGWDIAITDNGPVVIEGNSVGDVLFEQLISDAYFPKKYIQENIN